ncbi:hypothetical protein ACFLZ6_01395 [Nanoarchaeota archaeon]
MDNISKAYIYSISITIGGGIFNFLGKLTTTINSPVMDTIASSLAFILIALVIVHILVVGNIISKDAESKGLSKNHQLWAFIGILGVAIYHLGFSKRGNQPQQQYQQPPQQGQQPPQQQYQQQPGQYQQPQQQYPQQPPQ